MNWPIEDGARQDLGHADAVRTKLPRDSEVVLSIAISLKRIADALDNDGSSRGSILYFAEVIAIAAQASGGPARINLPPARLRPARHGRKNDEGEGERRNRDLRSDRVRLSRRRRRGATSVTSRYFTLDDGETEVDAEFTISGGQAPSGLSGPPEDYDPGSAFEVEVVSAVRVEDEDDGPGKAGDFVDLTEAELSRLTTEVNEDPETWEADDGPEYEDF